LFFDIPCRHIYDPNVSSASTTKDKTRNISFGSGPARFNINRRPCTPGPHEYCPKKILAAKGSQSRSIVFGSAIRACNAESPVSKLSPGPSEYDPESIRKGLKLTSRGSSSISFGSPSTDNGHDCLPGVGPQTYDPDAIRKGILFTRKSTSQSVTFGRPSSASRPASRRGRMKCDEQPGPQQYDTDAIRKAVCSLSTQRRPSGVVFTTGPRTFHDAEVRDRASIPGPCTYDSPSSIGNQANSRYKNQPRISFGSR